MAQISATVYGEVDLQIIIEGLNAIAARANKAMRNDPALNLHSELARIIRVRTEMNQALRHQATLTLSAPQA